MESINIAKINSEFENQAHENCWIIRLCWLELVKLENIDTKTIVNHETIQVSKGKGIVNCTYLFFLPSICS